MADPIFMLSLVDAESDAGQLDASFALATLPVADAFARAYGPFVDSLASLPLLIAADDALPQRIAG